MVAVVAMVNGRVTGCHWGSRRQVRVSATAAVGRAVKAIRAADP
jgi:hypothetical protein